MTGYGKAEVSLAAGKLGIEIRTLNAKGCDIGIKSSLLPKDKELLVRQKIADTLHRGTIDVFLSFEANAAESAKTINADLVKEYYNQLLDIRNSLKGIAIDTDVNKFLMISALRMPDVVDNKKTDIITEENWPSVEAAFDEALKAVCDYRAKEGAALYKDVTSRVANIEALENEVEALEPQRIEAVKARLQKNLDELAAKPDKERFEQELIFYIEKLDINEEKVRLRQHCKYFMDTIDGEPFPGKKLGFIIQEMGREINTTGSKANNADIQKIVVKMKDELEKIREQSLNIL